MAILACNKADDFDLDLGLNEFPSDTLISEDIRIQTVASDSTRTDNLNFHLLGNLNDSVFGPSSHAFTTELGLFGEVAFPSNAEVDSIILRLKYIDYYGNPDIAQRLGVYLLDEPIDTSHNYYNVDELNTATKIGEGVLNGFDSSGAIIRIPITDLWNASEAFKGGARFRTADDLHALMPGLMVKSEEEFDEFDGAVYYFNLIDLASGVTVYYHYYVRDGSTLFRENDEVDFQFQQGVQTFSTVKHNRAERPISDYLSPDSTAAQYGFVQAIGGSEVRIELPVLKELADSPEFAFHKVELVLPIETEFSQYPFDPIAFLDLRARDESGLLFDLSDKSKPYWTRTYDAGARAYVYTITSHCQNTLYQYREKEDFVDYGLSLRSIKNEPIPFSAGRSVIRGGRKYIENGAYLRIFYSKIDRP